MFADRLLVIDDEPAFCRLLARVAEAAGFEVAITDDPAVFVRTARTWQPAVIVLDLKMPGVNGVELLRDLAADRSAADVILASGVEGKVMDAAYELGRQRGLKMSGRIAKPARVEELRALLTRFKPMPKPQLAAELATAITSAELFLEYQPKIDCRHGRVIGAEALIRWRHPTFGLVRPDHFIRLAEEIGIIHRITDWVIASAAKQAATWRRQKLALQIAANISAADLQDRDLPERLERHCRDADVAPEALILELTETGAMRESMQMMDVLTRLRLKGFNLAIDDFGTGYSSLLQLQRMPFSELKIDRMFVMRMTNDSSCKVIGEIIIDLGRKLGLKSVAEGVEDKASLDLLAAMGCDMAQGYYISRPLPADGIPKFVADYEARRAPPVPRAARRKSRQIASGAAAAERIGPGILPDIAAVAPVTPELDHPSRTNRPRKFNDAGCAT